MNRVQLSDNLADQMKIYTKKGDQGETSLFGGKKVPKDALRLEAYGTVDELNSALGIAEAEAGDADFRGILTDIQGRLFDIGADLASPGSGRPATLRRIGEADITVLEKHIDSIEENLPQLRFFILPGGSLLAARLHFARAVCRRAERAVVRLSHQEEASPEIVVYLNRLSDFLFVLARRANQMAKVDEVQWKP